MELQRALQACSFTTVELDENDICMFFMLDNFWGRLTDWEHGTPPKITVSDFNFVLKVG